MGHQMTAPAVRHGWADAVALAGRLQRGESPSTLELGGLPAGELATLETVVTYEQSGSRRRQSPWGEPAPTDVVVTDRRILVSHPRRGLLSLWHVDLENLQLGLTGQQWHLDLHPVGINPRVRITGDAAPLVALHVAYTVFPSTWARLAGLLPLLDSAA